MATPPVNDDQALGFDPGLAVEHLRAADPVLARIIDEIGPFRMRLRPASSVFAPLAEAIAYQQLNGKAAAAIFARVCALFPEGAPTPERMLGIPDEQLRGAGLSRTKLLSLRDLAQRAADGRLPTLAEIQGMPDETIVERLSEVGGIGRWAVRMYCPSKTMVCARPSRLPRSASCRRRRSSPPMAAAGSRIGP